MTVRIGWSATAPDFQDAAKVSLENAQLRRNVKYATDVIRAKRAKVVNEVPDGEQLCQAGSALKAHTLRHLDSYPLQFEEKLTRAGSHVHCAQDADEPNRIIRRPIEQ